MSKLDFGSIEEGNKKGNKLAPTVAITPKILIALIVKAKCDCPHFAVKNAISAPINPHKGKV